MFCGYSTYCCHIVATPETSPLSKAKVTMLARINNRDLRFPYVPVEFKRNTIKFPIEWTRRDGGRVIGTHEFEPDVVMGFYARFPNNGVNPKQPLGKRLTLPLGKDPVTAYMEFQNLDQDFERIERGLAPVNVPADSPNSAPKMTLAQAVAKFERDLTARRQEAASRRKLHRSGPKLPALLRQASRRSARQNHR
jgi:hypothetical protein